MKTMKFIALSLLVIASNASAKIKISVGIVRNESVNTAANIILELDQRELCYQDETTYLEAELLEETKENVLIQFTVATKNETGAYMVRGLPKLSIPMNVEIPASASLRCDGPSESFMLVATAFKVEEAAAISE